MILPNLLNMALSVVGKQQFQYIKFLSRYTNELGLDVSNYASPVYFSGQVQSVPRNLYEKFGLDFQNNYLIFYLSKDVGDVVRDVSGDKFIFNGQNFQGISETDWFVINGWTGILAVHIP